MTLPSKTLPSNYQPAGKVSIKNKTDLGAMLLWSLLLPLAAGILLFGVLLLSGENIGASGSFSLSSPGQLLMYLLGIVLVIVIMVVLHEGLHGLVFWVLTREVPKFSFKWYYASACAEGWYLPRNGYLVAALVPLIIITFLGLLVVPFSSGVFRSLSILLVLFNASGCAGDVLVAIRLLRLPGESLSYDSGDEVAFYKPS